MTSALQVRRATSDLLYTRLKDGITSWLKLRRDDDERRQHATQLTAIETLLSKILDELDSERKKSPEPTPGAQFAAQDRLERRITWTDRLWQFFRVKFDQRDGEDKAQRATLKSADELVWSCYSVPIQRATAFGLRNGPAPAPIPFIEAQFAPEAFPSELVPPDLKSEIEAVSLLKEHLNRMPVPVVRLTPACVACPWWLVYIAHEVGHHVQYDLLPNKQLVDAFGDALKDAVKKTSGSDTLAAQWRRWSKEIFADIFSVICMGRWAVYAMVELEISSDDKMTEERDAYPSPQTRLALLAEACDRVTNSKVGTDALSGLVTIPNDSLRTAVLDTALGSLPGLGMTLESFYPIDRVTVNTNIEIWRDRFVKGNNQQPAPGIDNATALTGGALAAWEDIVAKTKQDDLPKAAASLGTLYTTAMIGGAPEGERAGVEEIPVDDLADEALREIWKQTQ
jgi:hypothetical protein